MLSAQSYCSIRTLLFAFAPTPAGTVARHLYLGHDSRLRPRDAFDLGA